MKDKRYIVTVRYYEYVQSEEAAYKTAIKRTSKMNKKLDCRATVDAIHDAPFASMDVREVDLEPLRRKHGRGFV